jgi:hypothetical protein
LLEHIPSTQIHLLKKINGPNSIDQHQDSAEPDVTRKGPKKSLGLPWVKFTPQGGDQANRAKGDGGPLQRIHEADSLSLLINGVQSHFTVSIAWYSAR